MNFFRQYFATPQTSTFVQWQPIHNVGTVNAIMNAITGVGYEPGEPMPLAGVVTRAAGSLYAFPIEHAEISPFYGEVNVTWKKDGDRVKATFGPDPRVFFVYRECFERGRVTYNHLEPNASEEYLRESLNWLETHHTA